MNFHILIASVFVSLILYSCEDSTNKAKSVELINDSHAQDSIFANLLKITKAYIPQNRIEDSLAFLLLPLEASCPSCRKKTIKNIIKFQDKLPDNHFIVISANGGIKTINSYFLEEGKSVTFIKDKLIMDSTNQAYKFDLNSNKPTMYYSFNKKAYKRVASVPSTIKEDLQVFFREDLHHTTN